MANLATAAPSPQAIFMDHFDRIQSIINQRCWSEERRQNALCWAWEIFCRYLPNSECPRQAAVAAAIFACRKRKVFGSPSRNGRPDVWDHMVREYLADTTAPTDTDRGWRIEDMPPRLQMVAKCLTFGLNRTETADKLGCCTYTVRRRTDEIAEWIRERDAGRYAKRD